MSQIDITGQKFGRLTAVKFDHVLTDHKKSWNYYWQFRCDCGKAVITHKGSVMCGRVVSCGCYKNTEMGNRFRIHGLTKSRFHTIWLAMRSRCDHISNNRYHRYGARGIKVCDSWQRFLNFKKDMYESYIDHVNRFGEKQTSIDRINNDLGYSKENCRWATCKEQANNRPKITKNNIQ